jgi:hypothetical protein
MGESQKFALIHMGTDGIYGLEFVAGYLRDQGHQFRWFDGDNEDEACAQVLDYAPNFVMLSPLTTFYARARHFSRRVKAALPQLRTIFGGHHVSAVPEVASCPEIDVTVIGPVYGTIKKIVESGSRPALPAEVIRGDPMPSDILLPARREYFEQIPRIGARHRKVIMSHLGCAFSCSFCSTSRLRAAMGAKTYKKYWLTRRPIPQMIEEAQIFHEFPTVEVNLADDDILHGAEVEEWLPEFVTAWKQEIDLPVYGFVTAGGALRVSDSTLATLASMVGTLSMGVQAARPESLRMFNRLFQKEGKIKAAYDRLNSFGIKVKLEIIVGLPVDDPVSDALDSIKYIQSVGAGTFGVAFPLMLYPGTTLYEWCEANNVEVSNECEFDWYTGNGSIKFEPVTAKRIRNLAKLSTFFVKYNIPEEWMRTLIDMVDLDDEGSRLLSESNYWESLMFRQGDNAVAAFDDALKLASLRF